ncbi:MAG: hypothetical protein DRN37_01470 [Thermoplasmata archaeon]|nr:MAG: hypothetical protein DRN07_03240 [Thermoplasmata archaeon]RLF61173.1 MAG: hypothetical protein DRN37_01470 [Thermoplasmata archaeon]
MTDIQSMGDISKIYDEIDEVLKFITTSGVRIKMMASILQSPKSSTQLKDELGVGASTVIHAARDLEKEGILTEKPDGYHLTGMGIIAAFKIIDMVRTLNTIVTKKDFWIEHDISDIPAEFLLKIYALMDSKIIKETPTDLMRGLSLYFKLVRKAKEMRGISSIFHPRFPDIIEKVAERGVTMEFLVTPNVFNTLKKEKYRERLKKLLERDNFSLYLSDGEIKLAFTVTDFVLSFALYLHDGLFDNATDLISYNAEAINWGRDLFEYYKSRAKRISTEDI